MNFSQEQDIALRQIQVQCNVFFVNGKVIAVFQAPIAFRCNLRSSVLFFLGRSNFICAATIMMDAASAGVISRKNRAGQRVVQC